MYQPKLGDRVEYRREIGRVTDVDPETGDLIIKCVDYVLVPLGDQMSVSRGSLAWLLKSISDFRQNYNITRGRLGQLIGTYPEFSDLKIIDLDAFQKLSAKLENVLSATTQMPQNMSSSDYETAIGPYMSQLKRDILQTQHLVATVKSLANSSVAELSLSAGSK